MRYWARIHKQTQGPFTVQDLAQHPDLTERTFICPLGSTDEDDWRRIEEMPELFRAVTELQKPKPPPPKDEPKSEEEPAKRAADLRWELAQTLAMYRPVFVFAVCAAALAFLLMSFHIVPSELSVFPKERLTFAYTFIDLKDMRRYYEETPKEERAALGRQYIFRKLLEKGFLRKGGTPPEPPSGG